MKNRIRINLLVKSIQVYAQVLDSKISADMLKLFYDFNSI